MEGRAFTLQDLKKAVILSCGGTLNEFYLRFWSMPLWEVIEAIELVTEINQKQETEADLHDILTGST